MFIYVFSYHAFVEQLICKIHENWQPHPLHWCSMAAVLTAVVLQAAMVLSGVLQVAVLRGCNKYKILGAPSAASWGAP